MDLDKRQKLMIAGGVVLALAYPVICFIMEHIVMIVASLAALLTVYFNYPAPKPSKEMWEWVKSGDYFNHRGYSIFYKVVKGKKADGPTLLLVHGFPTHSFDWKKVLPYLVEEFSQVVMFDGIGFGYSDKPADYKYSIFDLADIAEELLAKLNITKVHILAHDMGDTVTTELMARYEEAKEKGEVKLELLSVCLSNGGIFPEKICKRRGQKLLLLPFIGPYLPYLSNYYVLRKSMSEVFGPQTQPTEAEFQDLWASMRYKDGNIRQAQTIQYLPERFVYRDRWVGIMQNTSVPLHLVYGPSDPVNPPTIVDYYKEIVPNGGIDVLEDHIGHYPQWEDPEGVAKYYLQFFNKQVT